MPSKKKNTSKKAKKYNCLNASDISPTEFDSFPREDKHLKIKVTQNGELVILTNQSLLSDDTIIDTIDASLSENPRDFQDAIENDEIDNEYQFETLSGESEDTVIEDENNINNNSVGGPTTSINVTSDDDSLVFQKDQETNNNNVRSSFAMNPEDGAPFIFGRNDPLYQDTQMNCHESLHEKYSDAGYHFPSERFVSQQQYVEQQFHHDLQYMQHMEIQGVPARQENTNLQSGIFGDVYNFNNNEYASKMELPEEISPPDHGNSSTFEHHPNSTSSSLQHRTMFHQTHYERNMYSRAMDAWHVDQMPSYSFSQYTHCETHQMSSKYQGMPGYATNKHYYCPTEINNYEIMQVIQEKQDDERNENLVEEIISEDNDTDPCNLVTDTNEECETAIDKVASILSSIKRSVPPLEREIVGTKLGPFIGDLTIGGPLLFPTISSKKIEELVAGGNSFIESMDAIGIQVVPLGQNKNNPIASTVMPNFNNLQISEDDNSKDVDSDDEDSS